MEALRRYSSSSSTETASVSDELPETKVSNQKKSTNVENKAPTVNGHDHYSGYNQYNSQQQQQQSNKASSNFNEEEKKKKTSKPNFDNQNALQQPTSDLTFVKIAQTNKSNETAAINSNTNNINHTYQTKLNGISLSDTKLDEKTFVQTIDNEGALGSIISISPEEYEKKEADEQKPEGKQSSIITIFSIWNTMMGTSILVMPWAIQQAGFALGIFLLIFVAFIAGYCGYLVLRATEDLKIIQNLRSSVYMEFPDACFYHLGKVGYITAVIFSMLALFGALIVYYVLMCNFLYYTGDYIYHRIHDSNSSHRDPVYTLWNKTYTGAVCINLPLVPVGDEANIIINPMITSGSQLFNHSDSNTYVSLYDRLWSKTGTVPAWLLIVIIPLISIKSPTFLGKFNALGTISVFYLLILVCIKAAQWGLNLDFYSNHPYRIVHQAQPTFVSLTGVCSLAFFSHNALHTLTRSQRRPQNNTRDVALAFICVAATYLAIGLIFFCTFPLAKSCIEDNLLNNLSTDIPVFIGRFGSLLQMFTVYPMIMYILRVQLMTVIFKKEYPGFIYVSILHVIILGLCLTFAILLPKIGTIIQFSGSLCGLVYMFALPPLIYLLNKRELDKMKSQKETIQPEIHSDGKLLNGKGVLSNGAVQHQHQQMTTDDHTPFNEFQVDNRSESSSVIKFKIISERETLKWYLIVCIHVFIMLLGVLNFIGQFSVFFI
ncbi:unnamed protein product [Trichobilharzia szidati]|nr:unnamed protein product [Trichobilharzia szidati]